MSYRDLGNDNADEVERVAHVLDAPDPRHPTQVHGTPESMDGPTADLLAQPAPGAPRRRREAALVLLVALIASLILALGAYIGTRATGPDPSILGAPTTAAEITGPSPAAHTSAPPPSMASTPPPTSPPTSAVDVPPGGPSAAVSAGPSDDVAVPSAQAAADAFLPAWTMKGTPQQRRDALARVTTARLVEALADVDPANLPTVTGESLVDSVTANTVIIDVPTSAGLAQLTVEPVEPVEPDQQRWLVTAVSLKAPLPSATTTPPSAESNTGGAAA